MFDIRRLVRLGLLAAFAAGAACDDGPLEPVTPDDEAEPETADVSDVVPSDRTGFIADRARLMDPARVRLISTEAQLEKGEYRFTQAGGIGDSIRRNDVVVVSIDGEPRPRRG